MSCSPTEPMLLLTANISPEGGGHQTTLVIRDVGPRCQSSTYTKNGHLHNGTQHHRCQDWGGQFGACCEPSLIAEDTRALLERLLVERISWRGLCRAGGVNRKWLLGVLVQGIEALPEQLHVQLLTGHGDVMSQRLAVAAGAMRRVIRRKANKPWSWIARAAETRQGLALHGGAHSRKRAKRLWAQMPQAYRQPATFYPDQSVVYAGVLPAAQHRAISQLARPTHHMERFHNTLRQRVSRLVRATLSCSKQRINHMGAINMFIWHDNLRKAAV